MNKLIDIPQNDLIKEVLELLDSMPKKTLSLNGNLFIKTGDDEFTYVGKDNLPVVVKASGDDKKT